MSSPSQIQTRESGSFNLTKHAPEESSSLMGCLPLPRRTLSVNPETPRVPGESARSGCDFRCGTRLLHFPRRRPLLLTFRRWAWGGWGLKSHLLPIIWELLTLFLGHLCVILFSRLVWGGWMFLD